MTRKRTLLKRTGIIIQVGYRKYGKRKRKVHYIYSFDKFGRKRLETWKLVSPRQNKKQTLQMFKKLPSERKTFNEKIKKKIRLSNYDMVFYKEKPHGEKTQLMILGDLVEIDVNKTDYKVIATNVKGFSSFSFANKEDAIRQAKDQLIKEFKSTTKDFNYDTLLDVIVKETYYINYAKKPKSTN